jgi:hypothetical protein
MSADDYLMGFQRLDAAIIHATDLIGPFSHRLGQKPCETRVAESSPSILR